MSITTNDAHAWLEYWQPGKGWVALDPTPRLYRAPSMVNFIRDGYEWISAYWYRYVLRFSDRKSASSIPAIKPEIEPNGLSPGLKKWHERFQVELVRHWAWILSVLMGVTLLGAAIYGFLKWRYPWIFSIRYRVREGTAPLRRERIRMERLLETRLGSEETALLLASWQELYLRLRFGRQNGGSRETLQELGRLYRAVKRSLEVKSV